MKGICADVLIAKKETHVLEQKKKILVSLGVKEVKNCQCTSYVIKQIKDVD